MNPPKIEFDMKPHLFAYENVVFNLDTGNIVVPE